MACGNSHQVNHRRLPHQDGERDIGPRQVERLRAHAHTIEPEARQYTRHSGRDAGSGTHIRQYCAGALTLNVARLKIKLTSCSAFSLAHTYTMANTKPMPKNGMAINAPITHSAAPQMTSMTKKSAGF